VHYQFPHFSGGISTPLRTHARERYIILPIRLQMITFHVSNRRGGTQPPGISVCVLVVGAFKNENKKSILMSWKYQLIKR
jgi:hypothetical protein